MDVLSALPEEIFNKVVSHLSEKDILNGLLISRGWNQIFEKSSICMQKLTVKYNDQSTQKDLSVLLKSDRKYQRFSIVFHDCVKELGVEVNIRAILNKFSKIMIKLETSHDYQRICELPKLKEFEYTGSYLNKNYFCSNGLIRACPNINKLDIRCYDLDDNYVKIFLNSIQNMQNLKELSVNGIYNWQKFQIKDCNFKLDKFVCGSMREYSDFIKLHRSTLKSLKIGYLQLQDLQLIFTEFPKLHTLNCNLDEKQEKFNISENTTIKSLSISNLVHSIFERQLCLFTIVSKLKNLEELRLSRIFPLYLPAFFTCKSLKLVYYQDFDFNLTTDQMDSLINSETIKFIRAPFPR